MNKDLYTLQKNVIQWATERNILEYGKPFGQLKLLASELIELQDAINTGIEVEEMSELGDCLVVLTIIAEMRGFTLSEAYNVAWEKIKDRKGKLNKDGVFIKET
jgi:NTP pyrophosphatase (non-canonical NTP hydrolase)